MFDFARLAKTTTLTRLNRMHTELDYTTRRLRLDGATRRTRHGNLLYLCTQEGNQPVLQLLLEEPLLHGQKSLGFCE